MPGDITPDHVRTYSSLFVDERSHFHRKCLDRDGFLHRPRRLTDNDIERHLRGDFWLAVLRAPSTRILAVDLDAKGGSTEARRAMLERYRIITEILPPSLVVRSSASGGLHLYWFVTDAVNATSLVASVARRFLEAGLDVRSGAVEIRPTETLCLRLPLGRGSVLLQPSTLEPYADIGEDVPAAIDFLSTSVRRLSPESLWGALRMSSVASGQASPASACAGTLVNCPESNVTRSCRGDSPLASRVRELEQSGIPAEGQRHKVQFDIIRQSYLEGLSQEECTTRIRTFLSGPLREKHASRTLRENPEDAWKEALATIRSVYTNGARPSVRAPLSEREISVIWDATVSLNGHERYRQMLFLFDLFQRFKTTDADTVGLPRTTLTKMPGAHTETYLQRLAFAVTAGLVITDGVYGPGKCRRFRLLVPRDPAGSFTTLDEGLVDRDLSFLSEHMQFMIRERVRTGKVGRRAGRTAGKPAAPTRSIPPAQEYPTLESPFALSSPNPSNKLGKEEESIPIPSGDSLDTQDGCLDRRNRDGHGEISGAGQAGQANPPSETHHGKTNPEGPAAPAVRPEASIGVDAEAAEGAGPTTDVHGRHQGSAGHPEGKADAQVSTGAGAGGPSQDQKPPDILELVRRLNRAAGIGGNPPAADHATLANATPAGSTATTGTTTTGTAPRAPPPRSQAQLF